MKTIYESSISELCEVILDSYYEEEERYNDPFDFMGVNVVAKYDIIMKVLNCLLKETPFELEGALVYDPEYNWYDREFCISINNQKQMWVEPIYNKDGRYLNTGECLTYVHGDCNSKYLKENDGAVFIAFEIRDEEKDDEDDDIFCNYKCDDGDIKLHKDDDGNLNGFTQSYTTDNTYFSRSFFSTNDDMLKRVLERWT